MLKPLRTTEAGKSEHILLETLSVCLSPFIFSSQICCGITMPPDWELLLILPLPNWDTTLIASESPQKTSAMYAFLFEGWRSLPEIPPWNFCQWCEGTHEDMGKCMRASLPEGWGYNSHTNLSLTQDTKFCLELGVYSLAELITAHFTEHTPHTYTPQHTSWTDLYVFP